MLNKNIIYITGLPKAGSSLLCQLLAYHPEIYTLNDYSPLCTTLVNLRRQLSDSDALLSQLDNDFDLIYQRLISAFRGFINGWFNETEKIWVTDKNRDWLRHLELLHLLDPNCRVLVCVRALDQIYASIERQHQKTLLLDFPNHLADLSHSERALSLFSEQGIIGASLKAMEGLFNLDEELQKHLYYVVFEHLVSEPQEVMQSIYNWLEMPVAQFNPRQLEIKSRLNNSYNRFKYPHYLKSSVEISPPYVIPPHFTTLIKQNFAWYYKTFYPGL